MKLPNFIKVASSECHKKSNSSHKYTITLFMNRTSIVSEPTSQINHRQSKLLLVNDLKTLTARTKNPLDSLNVILKKFFNVENIFFILKAIVKTN